MEVWWLKKILSGSNNDHLHFAVLVYDFLENIHNQSLIEATSLSVCITFLNPTMSSFKTFQNFDSSYQGVYMFHVILEKVN